MTSQINIDDPHNKWALKLMSQGVIVKLSVTNWSATAKLTPECLGLKLTDGDSYAFMNKYITLGRQKLLPPETMKEVRHLASLAQVNLLKFSFNTIWGRFIPLHVFKEWENNNLAIREDFMLQARTLGENYDKIVATVKNEYKTLAKDVWFRLYANQGSPTESFIENFISKIVEKIPHQIDIVSSFNYRSTYFVIPMLSSSNSEQLANQIVFNEYVKRRQELIDDFLESTVHILRKYISELSTIALESIRNQPIISPIPSSQIKRLKSMIKKSIILNFYDDIDIKDVLDNLAIELNKLKKDMTRETLIRRIEEVLVVSNEKYSPKF